MKFFSVTALLAVALSATAQDASPTTVPSGIPTDVGSLTSLLSGINTNDLSSLTSELSGISIPSSIPTNLASLASLASGISIPSDIATKIPGLSSITAAAGSAGNNGGTAGAAATTQPNAATPASISQGQAFQMGAVVAGVIGGVFVAVV